MSKPDRAIPEEMTAAVMYGRQDVRIESVPTPSPAEGEVLLEVTAVGVCGTDAGEWANGPSLYPITAAHPVTDHYGPMVVGHEYAGRVVDLGEGVDPIWQGRLVASCGSMPCGSCAQCRAGRSNVCPRYAAVGLHRNGALAEYVATPVTNCIEVESLGLDAQEAALVQPMAIAVHSLKRAAVEEGDLAVVQGVGGIGAFLIHALISRGVRVVAVDVDSQRLEIARELGADTTIDAGEDDAGELIATEFGLQIPVVFEVSGTDAALQLALEIVPMGTTIVLVGIAKSPRTIDLGRVTVREISLIGTNATVQETDLWEAAELVASRNGQWGSIAPDPLPLADLVEGALRPIAEGRPPAVKTVLSPKKGA